MGLARSRLSNAPALAYPGGTVKRKNSDSDDSMPTKRHNPQLHTSRLFRFERFHREAWGKPLNPMLTEPPNSADGMQVDHPKHGEDNEEDRGEEDDRDRDGDVLLGDPFLEDIYGPYLVRAEYIRAFNKVKEFHALDEDIHKQPTPLKRRLVVVTGQPGIGKTMWIRYALRRCLGEKQLVAWYINGICYIFSVSGVRGLDPDKYEHATRVYPEYAITGIGYTWCFVDSADAPDTLPLSLFSVDTPFFPIYVTSPPQKRWEKLHQLRPPIVIVMNPWTLQEIEKVEKFYQTTRVLTEARKRFHQAGPTARLCWAMDDEDIADFYGRRGSLISNLTPQLFLELVMESGMLQINSVSHRICLVARPNHADMRSYTVTPITEFVRQQLRVVMYQWEAGDRFRLLNIFSDVPRASRMAGPLFEVHSQLSFGEGFTLTAKPMFRPQRANSHWHATLVDSPQDLNLSVTPTRVDRYSLMAGRQFSIERDVYYHPAVKNQVTIDSFIMHDDFLYLFQFTGGKQHGIGNGLLGLMKQFSGVPALKAWRFIFVIPESKTEFSCLSSNTEFLVDGNVLYVAQVNG